MSEKIYVFMMGGIGNQLFQYAAGLAVKKVTGAELYIYPAHMNKHSCVDYRNILYTEGRPQSDFILTEITYNQVNGFAAWDPASFKMYQTLMLRGYFQNLGAIKSVMMDMCVSIRAKLEKFDDYSNKTFLHIRRGDYLNYPELHHNLSRDYYEAAIAKYPENTEFAILSDDVEWCKNQDWLKGVIVEEKDELRALGIMASCNGGIIANSTFSWWGAMLQRSAGQIVYPSKWYGVSKVDIFPDGWICV